MPDNSIQYVTIYRDELRISGTVVAWMWDATPPQWRDPDVFVLPMPSWYVIYEQDRYRYDAPSNSVWDPVTMEQPVKSDPEPTPAAKK